MKEGCRTGLTRAVVVLTVPMLKMTQQSYSKTLLFHNQIDVLLRIASHPLVHQEYRFSLLHVRSDDKQYGWAEIMHTALEAHITLNFFYLKPETHNPQRKSAQGKDWSIIAEQVHTRGC